MSLLEQTSKRRLRAAKADPWASLVQSLDMFSDDFTETREQPVDDVREGF
ncbi:MAG: hypothetical protein ACLFOY_03915 [Desulfatibacillaceae bacterium]